MESTSLHELPSRRATFLARRALRLDRVPGPAEQLVPVVGRTADAIAERILHDVAVLRRTPETHPWVRHAVGVAVAHFVDLVHEQPVVPAQMHDEFDALGRRLARRSYELDATQAAFAVAAQHVRELLATVDARLDEEVVLTLHGAVSGFMDSLMRSVRTGYAEVQQRQASDRAHLRKLLMKKIRCGADRAQVESLAHRARWPVPQELMVCTVDVPPQAIQATPFPSEALTSYRLPRLTILMPEHVADHLLGLLISCQRTSPVAVAGPIPLEHVPAGFRWPARALSLAAAGHIEETTLIDCGRYHLAILMHTDPALMRYMRRDLLAPLRSLPCRQRAAITRTLGAWLPTHAEVKAVARQLDVHPNTVTNHIKRAAQLFGPRIQHDPGYATAIAVALHAPLDDTA